MLTIYSSGLPTSFRYVLPQDFPLCFIIITTSLSQQQSMAPQKPQEGRSGTKSSRTTGASSYKPPAETQLKDRYHLVHRDSANTATGNRTLDAQFTIVPETRSRMHKKQHAIGCKCSRIKVYRRHHMISHAAGVHSKLRDKLVAVRNWKPPWLTKAFVTTVSKIEHHNDISSGIFRDKYSDKDPQGWTKQALTSLEDSTEGYIVEVIAESIM